MEAIQNHRVALPSAFGAYSQVPGDLQAKLMRGDTQGRGTFAMTFLEYAQVSGVVQAKLVQAYGEMEVA